MNSFVANVIQYRSWFPVCHQSFYKGRKMGKDLMIPLSCYANWVRNIGGKQAVHWTGEKSKLLLHLKKMGIYWGRTDLAWAKGNSDPSFGLENHKKIIVLLCKIIFQRSPAATTMEGMDPARESWRKFINELGKKSGFAQGVSCDIQWWNALEGSLGIGQGRGKVLWLLCPPDPGLCPWEFIFLWFVPLNWMDEFWLPRIQLFICKMGVIALSCLCRGLGEMWWERLELQISRCELEHSCGSLWEHSHEVDSGKKEKKWWDSSLVCLISCWKQGRNPGERTCVIL